MESKNFVMFGNMIGIEKKKNFGREFHVEVNEKKQKMVDEEGLRK